MTRYILRSDWTAEDLERFMAGEWFSGMPVSPERLEEMRDELRRQLRERDAARETRNA